MGSPHTLLSEGLARSGAPIAAYYPPNSQQPAGGFTFALKTTADPGSIVRALRSEIARLDPHLADFDVHPMSELTDLSFSSRRTSILLANAFGRGALFLAALAIYRVLSYLVPPRTRAIGT